MKKNSYGDRRNDVLVSRSWRKEGRVTGLSSCPGLPGSGSQMPGCCHKVISL
ncbi:hypothetical protein ACFL4T_13260 [candidate division KSB1 bacterium]